MPTNTNGIFDFILDPESLINSTNAVAHGGKVFEENSTVFFNVLTEKSSKTTAIKVILLRLQIKVPYPLTYILRYRLMNLLFIENKVLFFI